MNRRFHTDLKMSISNLLTELNKAKVLESEVDYLAQTDEWRKIRKSIDQLTENILHVFLSVATHVAGNQGTRIFIADIDGAYFMGLQDYNPFYIEVKCITKSLYDALKENENTLKDL
jgi:hypothetical protein